MGNFERIPFSGRRYTTAIRASLLSSPALFLFPYFKAFPALAFHRVHAFFFSVASNFL